jgi:hypothetical protein
MIFSPAQKPCPRHDHLGDGAEHVYAVMHGTGTMIVDGGQCPCDQGSSSRRRPTRLGTSTPAMPVWCSSASARHRGSTGEPLTPVRRMDPPFSHHC